jgi:hypothetical protein
VGNTKYNAGYQSQWTNLELLQPLNAVCLRRAWLR